MTLTSKSAANIYKSSLLTVTVKPFPKLRNSQMMFVGVVTRSHRTPIATTLLHPTGTACRTAAAELLELLRSVEGNS